MSLKTRAKRLERAHNQRLIDAVVMLEVQAEARTLLDCTSRVLRANPALYRKVKGAVLGFVIEGLRRQQGSAWERYFILGESKL